MNKLLFKLQRNFNDDIAFLCNNTKDLENYFVVAQLLGKIKYNYIAFYSNTIFNILISFKIKQTLENKK